MGCTFIRREFQTALYLDASPWSNIDATLVANVDGAMEFFAFMVGGLTHCTNTSGINPNLQHPLSQQILLRQSLPTLNFLFTNTCFFHGCLCLPHVLPFCQHVLPSKSCVLASRASFLPTCAPFRTSAQKTHVLHL
jgi:hypothetical protein